MSSKAIFVGGLILLCSSIGTVFFFASQYTSKSSRICPQLADQGNVRLLGTVEEQATGAPKLVRKHIRERPDDDDDNRAENPMGKPTKMPRLPHSADCGNNPFLVIGVLSSPSPRSKVARDTLRRTWMKLPSDRPYTSRFLLAVNSSGHIPDELKAEADEMGDMIFLDTLEKYANLAQKVTLFFKWASDYCRTAKFVLKTDDDSFVRPNELMQRLDKHPQTRLLYGLGIGGMPAVDKHGNPRDGNIHKMPVWPPYMSGGGYVLSMDLAWVIGNPPVPYFWLKNEDVATGLRLYPYNISFVDDKIGIRPWGHCHQDAVLIHYQRRVSLLTRRYERALKGDNICGKPFNPSDHVLCTEHDEGTDAVIDCKGRKISAIMFASWGQQEAECEEGNEGFVYSTHCHALTTEKIVTDACVGKASCTVQVSNGLFGDPCPRETKRLRVVAKCA